MYECGEQWCGHLQDITMQFQSSVFYLRVAQLLPFCETSRKLYHRRDRIVVSTLRCGRNNPGSNPGHGNEVQFSSEKTRQNLGLM